MKIDAQAMLLASRSLQKNTPKSTNDKERMAETAGQFEAIFVQQMFKQMRQTVPDGGLLPRGNAENIYSDMQDMEAAKQVAKQGGIGLAKMLLEQMSKNK